MSDTSNTILPVLRRINLISGKGGVGRSTLSAVLAKASAEAGKKTLLAELEDESGMISPLAHAFGLKRFNDEPEAISKNLHALSLSPSKGQELFLNSFLKISSLTKSILHNQGVKWFLEGAPAFREMGYFYHLLLQLRGNYDTVILDLPATGHLVGLARLPRLLLKMIPFGPIADRLKEGQSYFYDQAQTAAWIVTLPQTLPVSEAIELKAALEEERIPFGGFILNRMPFNPFNEFEISELEGKLGHSDESLASSFSRIQLSLEAENKLKNEVKNDSAKNVSLWEAPEVFLPLEELADLKRIGRVQC